MSTKTEDSLALLCKEQTEEIERLGKEIEQSRALIPALHDEMFLKDRRIEELERRCKWLREKLLGVLLTLIGEIRDAEQKDGSGD